MTGIGVPQRDGFDLLTGRVGLIANHTCLNRDLLGTVEVLHTERQKTKPGGTHVPPGAEIVHGIRRS